MRLTLRTLLAYLDDTLEPSQAKLIGEKVAESDAAQELIGRIKQVTRRRRLTTPPQTGPGAGLDPNTIAEYLDNALPSEQLGEVEETCLASDVHLAEVAACHQILTLVLGEPALVPPTARQRMYGLIRGREAIPGRKVTAPAIGQGAVSFPDGANDEADETLLLGLPLSRPGSWLRWLIPLAAVCLLIGAGLSIWRAILEINEDVNRQPFAVVSDRNEENKAEPLQGPEPPPQPPVEKKIETPVITAPAPPAKVVTEKPKATEVAKASEPPPAKAPPVPMTSPSTERRDVGKAILVAAAPSVLLQRRAEGGAWQRLRPESRVFTTDSLVSLPGYRSELNLESGVHLMLWGNVPQFSRFPVLESAVTLYATPSMDMDFRLDHGRVVLSNHKEKEGPAGVRLRFHDEIWDLTLQDNTTEVSADLVGECLPYSKEPGGGEPLMTVYLCVLKGQAELKVRYERHLLTAPTLYVWDRNLGPPARLERLPQPPDWWTSKLPANTRDAQQMATALKSLSTRLIAKDRLDVALAETSKDSDTLSRTLAVHCLGAMAEWPKLLDALTDEKHPDVRVTTIHELRHLLGLGTKNDQKLHDALRRKNYSEGQAQTILQLLHRFSKEQWDDPTTKATVLEYLNHDKLAIRQLSHWFLYSIVPELQKAYYDPAGDSEQRERGAKEWAKVVLGSKPPAKPEKKK